MQDQTVAYLQAVVSGEHDGRRRVALEDCAQELRGSDGETLPERYGAHGSVLSNWLDGNVPRVRGARVEHGVAPPQRWSATRHRLGMSREGGVRERARAFAEVMETQEDERCERERSAVVAEPRRVRFAVSAAC